MGYKETATDKEAARSASQQQLSLCGHHPPPSYHHRHRQRSHPRQKNQKNRKGWLMRRQNVMVYYNVKSSLNGEIISCRQNSIEN